MSEKQEIQKKTPEFTTLDKVQQCGNVYVEVLSVNVATEEQRQNKDEKINIYTGSIADSTAIRTFKVVGDKYKDVLKKGNTVAFRNLKVRPFEGQKRLTVDIWGKISNEPEQKGKLGEVIKSLPRTKVAELTPGENGQNVAVKVLSITKQGEEEGNTRKFNVVEGTCGDETAQINFRVTGKFAEGIEKGKSYMFINCMNQVHEEIHRLASGFKGKVEKLDEDVQGKEGLKDLSSLRYEKVSLDDQKK